jgi:hypothetical protein
MFVREQVRLPAPVAVVRNRMVERVRDDGLALAARDAIHGGRTVQNGSGVQEGAAVTVQARAFSQIERTVVALRVFTRAESEENQPTLDVNLEVEPAGPTGTLLTLAGIIRPFPSFARKVVETGVHDRDLLAVGQRFLNEVAALLAHDDSEPGPDDRRQKRHNGPTSDGRGSAGETL